MVVVVAQPLFGVADSGHIVALILCQLNQPLQRREEGQVQLFTQGRQPVVVAAGQQLAAVEGYGALQRGSLAGGVTCFLRGMGVGHSLLEVGHVEAVGGARLPLERRSIGVQPTGGRVGQGGAQPV